MADNILRSYGDTSIQEDVLAMIEILTAPESWFLNNLGKVSALLTVHQVQVDTLRTAASQAVEEADDFTNLENTSPTLQANLVEKIAIPFKVSTTQALVRHFSGQDEKSRQTVKAMEDWGNSAEFDLVRSSLVSGASGTVPKMDGILRAISTSTSYTLHNSGTVLSVSIINGLMKNNMDTSNGDAATDIFAGSYLRGVIDSFTQKSTTVVNVNATEILNTVDVISTSFGRLAVHYHRYVQQSGDSTGRLLAVRPEKLKIAYLSAPHITDLAKSGDYDFRAVLGDLTLEVRNKKSNWFAEGFSLV